MSEMSAVCQSESASLCDSPGNITFIRFVQTFFFRYILKLVQFAVSNKGSRKKVPTLVVRPLRASSPSSLVVIGTFF